MTSKLLNLIFWYLYLTPSTGLSLDTLQHNLEEYPTSSNSFWLELIKISLFLRKGVYMVVVSGGLGFCLHPHAPFLFWLWIYSSRINLLQCTAHLVMVLFRNKDTLIKVLDNASKWSLHVKSRMCFWTFAGLQIFPFLFPYLL